MTTDWNNPTVNSTKTNFPVEVRNVAASAIKLDPHSDANIPSGAIYLEKTNYSFSEYNGSAFVPKIINGVRTMWMGTSGGSANAQTGTVVPEFGGLQLGLIYAFKAGFTCTGFGVKTFTINAYSAATIKDPVGANPSPGMLTAGNIYLMMWDGTNLVLLNPSFVTNAMTPTWTGSGSMTVTVDPSSIQRYRISQKRVEFDILIPAGGLVIGGTPSTLITISNLPFTFVTSGTVGGICPLYNSPSYSLPVFSYVGANSIAIQTQAGVNFSTGNWGLILSGSGELA